MIGARVFIIAIVTFINTDGAVLSGKGLFCRDPDTGKLHPVNATWSSTSFCGNYTCKQRKLNQTNSATPIREFNITNVILKNETQSNTTEASKNTTDVVDNKLNLEPELSTESLMPKLIKNDQSKEENDRYLTEYEIQSIANVLHKVKKSDIDALVEVYTLAQELYHEMDKVTDQEAVDESVNNLKEKIQNLKPQFSKLQNQIKPNDMETQSTNTVPRTNKLKKEAMGKYPSYFSGPLTFKDFGKVPYYYPISSFQRMSSYMHQPSKQVKVETSSHKTKDIRQKEEPERKEHHIPAPIIEKDSQKLIQPSYLLPYPFSYVNKYNMSRYANMYSSNPWVWDYYYRQKQNSPYLKAYLAHIPAYAEAVLINPHLHDEEIHDVEQPVVKKQKNKVVMKKQEPWKTQPLSNEIINEIKANMDSSQIIKKAFPLRKKVKIEKVGKVIKMDELTRVRRDANKDDKSEKSEAETVRTTEVENANIAKQEDEYETYMEKITCQPQTVPGYFRYGNLTEPYPHCCPQLIRNR